MEILGCGSSQVRPDSTASKNKQHAGVPNTWDGERMQRHNSFHRSILGSGPIASAVGSPSHAPPCRSEAELDEEVRMAGGSEQEGKYRQSEEDAAARTVKY